MPVKTRHNEVAPGQYEIAPIFEQANLATDHQMLTMETLRKVAQRYGMVCLLHEKPFAGINGSGKHNNWSMSTDQGENLLNPGDTPHDNAQFLVFCAAVFRAVHKYAGLLRMSVAGASNDHRLGANEAPPAIICVFLGEQLTTSIEQIEKGTAKSTKSGGHIEVGVSMLPKLPRDAGDRNRTSPFAFTGNKFEFRAVGSSQSVAGPNTVLNTIVAESLDYVATEIEKLTKGKRDEASLNKALQKLLPQIVKDFKPILFEGDNYSAQWHAEAETRGLPNYRNTVDAVELYTSKESLDLFTTYKVYSKRELASRRDIGLENYIKTVHIEGLTASMMASTQIIPAAMKYQAQIGGAIAAARAAAGVEDSEQAELLNDLVATIAAFHRR